MSEHARAEDTHSLPAPVREKSDVTVRFMAYFCAGTATCVVLLAVLAAVLFPRTSGIGLHPGMLSAPAQPAVQSSPRRDMNALRGQQLDYLDSPGWVDRAPWRGAHSDRARHAGPRGARHSGMAEVRAAVVALCLAVALALPARAQTPDLSGLGFEPHPGARVPLDQPFVDDNGTKLRLRDLLHGKPAVLDLGYYTCPNLCGTVRDDLSRALARSGLSVPRDLNVIALSIDPAERPADAARAKAANGADGWHFLTGPADAVAIAVGFPYRRDDRQQQFLHPSGIVVLTPAGVVSGYLLGVGYDGAALRRAVARAGDAIVAPPPSPILLLCLHYDPATGTYSFAVLRAMQAAGALTALTLGLWLAAHHVRRRA